MESPRILVQILRQHLEEPCQQFLTRNSFILKKLLNCDICNPKFKLGNSFVTDFLLVKSALTHGERLVLVEIEPATSPPFTKSGKYSERLNAALNQINDWIAWIERERGFFERSIPTRFRNFFSTSIESVVIIGRRSHLSEKDDERRGAVRLASNHKIQILHYDNILEEYERHYDIWRLETGRVSTVDLLKLGTSKDDKVRAMVAGHHLASADLLDKLSNDRAAKVAAAVARNPKTQRRTSIALAKKGLRVALETVSDRWDADLETRLEIFRDGSVAAKHFLMEDEIWPSKLLEEAVADHDNPEFRILALNRKGTSIEVLSWASRCLDLETKLTVLMHKDCPIEVRERLVNELSLSRWWDRRPDFLDLFLRSFGPQLALEFWEELANHKEARVRSLVVSQASVPRMVFQALQNDKSLSVRRSSRRSRRLSETEVLSNLSEESSSWERSRIVAHPSIKSRSVLEGLAKDEDAKVRFGILNNPNVCLDLIQVLSTDPESHVRKKAAGMLDAVERKKAE